MNEEEKIMKLKIDQKEFSEKRKINSGNFNSGNWNSGNWNSGNWNLGNFNSGNWNSGDWNSGEGNSGDTNSGDWNSGNWNSGKWNSGNWNSGFLNTNKPKIRIFNKETNRKKIKFPDYFYFNFYVRIDHPLKKIDYKEAWKESFKKATKEDVATTLELPNFDYSLFEEITGITKKMLDAKLK
jgi:hypothetical protein